MCESFLTGLMVALLSGNPGGACGFSPSPRDPTIPDAAAHRTIEGGSAAQLRLGVDESSMGQYANYGVLGPYCSYEEACEVALPLIRRGYHARVVYYYPFWYVVYW